MARKRWIDRLQPPKNLSLRALLLGVLVGQILWTMGLVGYLSLRVDLEEFWS